MGPGGSRRVLVVDDNDTVRGVVVDALLDAGYSTVEAASGPEALEQLRRGPVDLVLLDVILPGIDGLEVLARVRRDHRVPIILLTGRSSETDRIVGLELGADDYVVKPFSPGELVARVKAVLRRTTDVVEEPADATRRFADLAIDPRARQATVRGAPVALTHRELELLFFLSARPGQVFSREQLLVQVWDSSSEWQGEATVTEHARRLRIKLEAAGDTPGRIRTVRGFGYSFEPERRP